jgi:hypothetical protein
MNKRQPRPDSEAAEELAALIHMTRFMADAVDRVVPDPHSLKRQLDQIEAELQIELQHTHADLPQRTN